MPRANGKLGSLRTGIPAQSVTPRSLHTWSRNSSRLNACVQREIKGGKAAPKRLRSVNRLLGSCTEIYKTPPQGRRCHETKAKRKRPKQTIVFRKPSFREESATDSNSSIGDPAGCSEMSPSRW